MRSFRAQVVKFLQGEDGPTAVEYGVMLALIIMAVMAAVITLGLKANSMFNAPSIGGALGGS